MTLPQGSSRLVCPSLCSSDIHDKHTSHTSHAQMCIHRHEHSGIFFLFLAQSGYTALLQAAYSGHTEVVRMLVDEFGCSVDVEENVSEHASNVHYVQHLKWLGLNIPILQCNIIETTEVSGLHWRMYCGMYNMWHKGMDWLCMCQSHVHSVDGQLSWCQQKEVTFTWWGSWWSSLEQTFITRQRRAVHLLTVIQSVIHICHVHLYSLWFTSFHYNTHMHVREAVQSDWWRNCIAYIALPLDWNNFNAISLFII